MGIRELLFTLCSLLKEEREAFANLLHLCIQYVRKFKILKTNGIISFEQLDPEVPSKFGLNDNVQ